MSLYEFAGVLMTGCAARIQALVSTPFVVNVVIKPVYMKLWSLTRCVHSVKMYEKLRETLAYDP